MSIMSAAERRAIADQVGADEQYLYQCLTGRKAMKAKEAVRIERESGQRVRRWQLRQRDWYTIWPDLVGTDGAPPVPAVHEEGA